MKKTLLLVGLIAVLLQGCAIAGGAAAGVAVANDRRTTGTMIDDQIIEIKVLRAINTDKALADSTHINVTSYNNIVLLSGETPTPANRKKLAQLASQVEKVRKIHNELTIAAPSSLITRSSDTLITAKAKTQLLGLQQFDPTRVKVVTENGTVFLLGLVTREEARRATEAIRQVGGVQRVVKLFEYID